MKAPPKLNLPRAPLRLRTEDGRTKVFDILREKWVAATPEEWVRQHFIHWLNTGFGYPLSMMANETAIEVNGTRKRCDTVVFGTGGWPEVIVEYKAPEVEITQDVFDQIVRYNISLRARYLMVSNGLSHYCCKMDYTAGTYNYIRTIPPYHTILGTGNN